MTNLKEQNTLPESNLAARPDYRQLEHRWEGFDRFYHFHVATGDYAPYLEIQKWMLARQPYDYELQVSMAFFFGAIGPMPCSLMVALQYPKVDALSLSRLGAFFFDNKQRMFFTGDCKYRKLVFGRFLDSVAKSLRYHGTLGGLVASAFEGSNQQRNYLNLQAICFRDWYHWGHYGHWCFCEALKELMTAPIQPPKVEFALNASCRQGWALAMGRDDLASSHCRSQDLAWLEEKAASYVAERGKTKADFFSLETACCNYKRQWKASHYGGCYIDEQYDEIRAMEDKWPEKADLWQTLWKGRQATLPSSLLYENYHPRGKAYQTVLHRAFIDQGRIPRVEAWLDQTPQEWPSAPHGEMVISNSI